jgi:hypothetical protein
MAALAWLADSLAALMLLTSAYCLSRLTLSWYQHRPTDRQVDGVHVLMGVAMAGMLVPSLRVLQASGWEIVFGASAVFFGWRMISRARGKAQSGRQCGHPTQHVLACAAMVYMLAAAATAKAASGGSAAGGMAGGAAHVRTLALVLAIALFGYVVWTADRMSSLAPVTALASRALPPALVAGTRVTPATADRATADSATVHSATAHSATAGGASSYACSAPEPASRHRISVGQRARVPLSPRLAACCEIAMGVTMGYMLITML